VNEAFIMYNHNKTREWLHQLEPEEKKKILEDSKQEGRQFRDELKKNSRILKPEDWKHRKCVNWKMRKKKKRELKKWKI
jgi:hypothetical protein